VNPMIGSGLQQGCEVAEEQTVEVVRNHEGGTPEGDRHSLPEGGAGRSDAGTESSRSADSTIRYDGGAFFGQPQERKPGLAAGSQGPERVGKVGAKVRRVARTCYRNAGKRAGRRSSRIRARRSARRSRRAAVNGQGAATSIGFTPPAGGTCRLWRCGADHAPAQDARHRQKGGSPFRRQVPQPRGARRNGSKGPYAPEDQVNHIPVRRAARDRPTGDNRRHDSGAAGHGSRRTRPSVNL